MRYFLLVFSFLWLRAFADTNVFSANENIDNVLKQNTYEPNYFSLLFGLFFVIALIYITGIAYKKLSSIKLDKNQDEKNKIEILNTVSLGQNKSLHVIKINNETCIIGATPNSINLIKNIDLKE